MTHRNVLLPAVLLTALLSGCGANREALTTPVSFPAEVARLVSHASSGPVDPAGDLRVRFVEPVIQTAAVGRPVTDLPLRVTPRLKLGARWEDTRTLVLTPVRPLEQGTVYTAVLDLSRLVPEAANVPDLRFRVEATPVEIRELTGQFVALEDPGAPGYRGRILLSREVDAAGLERAITVRVGGRRVPLTFDRPSTGKAEYFFQTGPIARTTSVQDVVIQVNGERLGIGERRTVHLALEAADVFALAAIEPMRQDRQQGFRLSFSDPLDPAQTLDGLIRVAPATRANLRRSGSVVYLLGDFLPGERYTVELDAHLQSELGREMGSTTSVDVSTPDLSPAVAFLSSGVFLPSSGGQTLGFRTQNLRRVRVLVTQVYENNLGQFLQTESLSSEATRASGWNSWEIDRVGVAVAEQVLEIGDRTNQWVVSALEMDKLFRRDPAGLYLVTLRYDEEDVLSSPGDWEYRYWESEIYKPVLATDIGLTYKQTANGGLVYATDLVTAQPLGGVTVSARTYQNQLLDDAVTDTKGLAVLEAGAGAVFYVVAQKTGQRGLIKLNEMPWELSSFDIGGEEVAPDGTRVFAYTERGVYRPGDEVNLSYILRNPDGTFPAGHPVTLTLYNPREQKVLERTLAAGTDGFFSFAFSTGADDPTGTWRADLLAGSRTFQHPLRIETIVPYRLKVLLEPDKPAVRAGDRELGLTLSSTYLFGTPAAGLQAELSTTVQSAQKSFARFPGYTFTNEAVDYEPTRSQLYADALDDTGSARVVWDLPSFTGSPSALQAELSARVYEKGGRPNIRTITVPVDPYEAYVGLRKPELDWGYARTGSPVEIGVVLVSAAGNAVAGRQLEWRVYRNTAYWWWEFDSRREFRLSFKTDTETRLVRQGRVTASLTPATISFTPEEWGEYLIEVTDSKGHTAAFFLSATSWGDTPAGASDAALLALKTDKALYAPGETAVVTFPRPREGTVLLTVEGAGGVLEHTLSPLAGTGETAQMRISVTRAMIPNAYVAVSVIQPHRQTTNDRPIRLYGVVPLRVEDPASHQTLTLTTPEVIRPNQPFTVEIQTTDGQPTQLTLAVVDEGLLDITAFPTPDPWKAFNAKQRLAVSTYDVFSHVIGANSGDYLRVFSVGGDYDQGLYTGGDKETRRFEPVSIFRGPFRTDTRGKASVTLTMPSYMGSVRVMAVAANGSRYGSAELNVPVKEDLVILPTLPRVLGPEEEITVPVTVFGLRDSLGDVEVSLGVSGPLTIVGSQRQIVTLSAIGEKDVYFRVRAKAEVGDAGIIVRATARGLAATSEVTLPVRASSPRVSESQEVVLERGKSVRITVPARGLAGTNEATLRVSRLEEINIDRRVAWLIQYPYGCIEQTTSAVFPQLYLKTLLTKPGRGAADIDRNINAAISRLRTFQTASGAFSFWPGQSEPSDWGTNYAGHFLLEAKALGYFVPEDMLQGWLRYQSSRALTTAGGLMERVYRVMLLSLAGEPSLAGMNLLRESSLRDMNDTMKWMLAASYRLRGMESAVTQILSTAGVTARDYVEAGSSYGSKLRDQGILLSTLVLFERWQPARELFREIATVIGGEDWFSTQSLGYALLALGKYVKTLTGSEAPLMQGRIQVGGSAVTAFSTRDLSVTESLTRGFGEPLTVSLDAASTMDRVYVSLDWSGIPARSEARDTRRNLEVAVEWLDEAGGALDPATIEQGTTFWGRITVAKTLRRTVQEVALTQILPSGWEIENTRLTGEVLPEFLAGANESEYTDIRDDRVHWFFDMAANRSSYQFAVKLNAVTVGRFDLPPTLAEAMYDSTFLAIKTGGTVRVIDRR